MKKHNLFVKSILSAIYPNKCICCSEIIGEGSNICDKCNDGIERNNFNDMCLECGLEKDSCVCKFNVYRFDKLVCVFKNIGLARTAYYGYKFGKKQHYVHFFANEMCNAVNLLYSDIKFDYVCSVPSASRFSYDHCGYLAERVSDLIKVPYKNDILTCTRRTKRQHLSTIKERLKNVENKYKYNYRIQNANVLLVDDIKTTGATLDECAKTLLYAGANHVYCVVALGTTNNQNKN